MLALANALIDHPERTLNSAEIDQCIAGTLHRETMKAEIERQRKWVKVLENATDFIADLEK